MGEIAKLTPLLDCHKCEGKGWYWRVPEGFNPFLAGGFSTARAMCRAECQCSKGRFEAGRLALAQEDTDVS